MHAIVAEAALLIAAVFGVFSASVFIALLLGGKTLPRTPPVSYRKTGTGCSAAAEAIAAWESLRSGNTRPH